MEKHAIELLILRCAATQEEAEELVRHLASVNWMDAFRRYEREQCHPREREKNERLIQETVAAIAATPTLPPAEYQRLDRHCRRAFQAGTPLGLTANQWARTLSHFRYQCAYCGVNPYEALEHYLPIALGGGTTVDNCLPACASCGNRKRRTPPSDLGKLFSPEALTRIRDYFTSVQRYDKQ